MKQAQINLPVNDNDGVPRNDAHHELIVSLIEAFGGCTVIPNASGYWMAPDGKLTAEPVNIYQVAGNNNDVANMRLLTIVRRIGHLCKQQVMYYIDFNGDVQFEGIKQ